MPMKVREVIVCSNRTDKWRTLNVILKKAGLK